MNKKELKLLIKPLVKECIQEALIEEGLLSNVVAEVAKGMQGNLVVEQRPAPPVAVESNQRKVQAETTRKKLSQHRKKLLDSIGNEAFNGVDLFEGTEPLRSSGNPDAGTTPPSLLGEDTSDAGVDISTIIGSASNIWKSIK